MLKQTGHANRRRRRKRGILAGSRLNCTHTVLTNSRAMQHEESQWKRTKVSSPHRQKLLRHEDNLKRVTMGAFYSKKCELKDHIRATPNDDLFDYRVRHNSVMRKKKKTNIRVESPKPVNVKSKGKEKSWHAVCLQDLSQVLLRSQESGDEKQGPSGGSSIPRTMACDTPKTAEALAKRKVTLKYAGRKLIQIGYSSPKLQDSQSLVRRSRTLGSLGLHLSDHGSDSDQHEKRILRSNTCGSSPKSAPASARYDMESSFPGLRHAIRHKYGNFMRAWIVGFKQTFTSSLSFPHFVHCIHRLREGCDTFKEEIDYAALFNALDTDKTRRISLRELDPHTAFTLEALKDCVVARFDSVVDLFNTLDTDLGTDGTLTQEEFVNGLRNLGFTGDAELLFAGLDANGQGSVSAEEFLWLEADLHRKHLALSRLQGRLNEEQRLIKQKAERSHVLKYERHRALWDFLRHCKKKMGNMVRAWRYIDQDLNLSISRIEFMKFCADTGFEGNRKLAWLEADKDNSGEITLEELDMCAAHMLAQFQHFINTKLDSWDAVFDQKTGLGQFGPKISEDAFVHQLEVWGFRFDHQSMSVRRLYRYLDFDGCNLLRKEDVFYLKNWNPPPWMTCAPDYTGKALFIQYLKQTCNTVLNAWRMLDADGSNRVSWDEFRRGAKYVNFPEPERLPGIWSAFDPHSKGYLSLKDIDVGLFETLLSFVEWAREHFGDVTTAFHELDHDHSGALSYSEFGSAVHLYGFKGNARKLFRYLDITNRGEIEEKMIHFLDDWDLSDEDAAEDDRRWDSMKTLLQRERLQDSSQKTSLWFPKLWCTRSERDFEHCEAIRTECRSASPPLLPSIGSCNITTTSGPTSHNSVVSLTATRSYGTPLSKSFPFLASSASARRDHRSAGKDQSSGKDLRPASSPVKSKPDLGVLSLMKMRPEFKAASNQSLVKNQGSPANQSSKDWTVTPTRRTCSPHRIFVERKSKRSLHNT